MPRQHGSWHLSAAADARWWGRDSQALGVRGQHCQLLTVSRFPSEVENNTEIALGVKGG